MGLFGGSKSSTSTENTNTEQVFSDISDNASIQSIVGDGNTVSFSDHGAIGKAFDFAGSTSSEAFNFVEDITAGANKLASDSIKAVNESAREDTENVLLNLQKFAIYGGLIWGAVEAMKILRGKK